MFAARDQENLVRAHQIAAVSKPLNQGTRQLQPKTPGTRVPKTPFKAPLNDENNPLTFGGGKQTLKDNNNGQNENLRRSGKDGIAGKNALVTPMCLHNRAPLGIKTTNAKAKGFQTPTAPMGLLRHTKTTKRPSTTQKLKHNAPEVQQCKAAAPVDIEEDVNDIEYMSPRPIALPDPPENIPYDTTFPQFKGKNFTRGWHKLYPDNEVGEDGLTRRQREMKRQQEAYDKQMEDMIQKEIDNMELLGINVRQFPHEPCAEEIALDITRKQVQKQQTSKMIVVDRSLSTIKSRTAARLLSQQQSRPTMMPAPVSSSTSTSTPFPKCKPKPKGSSTPRIRFSSGLFPPKKQPTPTNPSTFSHVAATVSSRTTVGYSKGRSVVSNLRQKPTNAANNKQSDRQTNSNSSKSDILSPARYMQLYGNPPFGSEMWSRCKAAGLFDAEVTDAELDAFLEEIPSFTEEDEEYANFQLTL
ncbi:hypothetical protein PAAG_09115 [Paracoccidioides lutzii Pb01]|uniref:Uncharacterized protein n=1 Tax=Paracoccidioides lutzii (strain ATCC MYA-826 / Pb01) TaxID=502779 RepID=C1HEC4_PARBA|nr:hypothetical protein PAAG_09115 [Paracoccidioides lutzii Pb01]EEH41404.2 hypothetical protein PAAG_09115 [Paracoccidioides lutzii Pb01]